jgi:hypothetical protein
MIDINEPMIDIMGRNITTEAQRTRRRRSLAVHKTGAWRSMIAFAQIVGAQSETITFDNLPIPGVNGVGQATNGYVDSTLSG